MTEITICARPNARRAFHLLSCLYGTAEVLNCRSVAAVSCYPHPMLVADPLAAVERHDSELILQERIAIAYSRGDQKPFLGQIDIRKLEVFFADEQIWEVRTWCQLSGPIGAEREAYPRNSLAHVENAVIAASCSPSYASEWEYAIQAGAYRWSIKFALLRISEEYPVVVRCAHLKYGRASAQRLPEKYQRPTAYHVVAAAGSCWTSSCASRKREEWSRGMWCMHERWMVNAPGWAGTRSRILPSAETL